MRSPALSRRDALSLLAAGGTGLLAPRSALAQVGSPEAAAALDAIAWRLLRAKPEGATSLGVDKAEHAALRAMMEDRSPEGVAAIAELLRRDLRLVEAIRPAGLDAPTRTSLAVVRTAYRTALDGMALPYGDVAVGGWRNAPYVVIQNVGAYLDVPRFLDADHPVSTEQDAADYLSRLSHFARQLDGERARMREAEAAGLVPPDFLIDKTLLQLDRTLAEAAPDAPGGGALVTSLTRRAGNIPGDWEGKARRIVMAQVAPALTAQRDALRALRGKARPDPGIGARPHGAAYYRWALRAGTTTALSPDEIHRQGRAELAELHARMDAILRPLGYGSGTVGERMAALSRDPRFMFPEGDPGRAEIMGEIARRIDWIRAQMPRAFRRQARGNVEVRRLPPSEEPGAPAAYGGAGSIDGTTPGRMWINLRTTDLHRRYDLPTLTHHETIPGHVWQGDYANGLPLIRSILSFNAFSEGWGLYAEQLADELGAYGDDPVGRLGYLQSLAFRACRMVVDTGLHARGWSRDEAIRFFIEQNGNKRDEVESEVDRYCSWPGQACGYKMGHSEILRQRAMAQAALGRRFDLRDFDQAVVDGGNVPLDVLGENVARYVAAARG